jgi:hypothetical protein
LILYSKYEMADLEGWEGSEHEQEVPAYLTLSEAAFAKLKKLNSLS